MYVGVDIGGTKTLLTALDKDGVIVERALFPTPKTYEHFLLELKHKIAHFAHQEFKAGAIAVPGRIDREHGRGINLGNLSWKNFNIQYDAEQILHCPIAIENDAKLAGLSESMLLKDKYRKVAYVTVSTGIGYALIVDNVIDTSLGDTGGRALLLEHEGKLVSWEDFAGGRAIVERYGKLAKDIKDEATLRKISRDLAKGLVQLIAIMEPEVIVFGGSVGRYFDRYGSLLRDELKKYELPMVKIPVLREAQRPEDAVAYGCYDLAKQVYGHAKNNR